MVVSPQRLTRWPSYVRDRHAAITYTTPRDAPPEGTSRAPWRRSSMRYISCRPTTAAWCRPSIWLPTCSGEPL
ncbi:hypothetical protein DKM27_08540 [Mycobacterium tuberculosis variant bovis]|nr:hypothetical protein DKM27_08540 [Mycobacterium tuberculosis variant bovis]